MNQSSDENQTTKTKQQQPNFGRDLKVSFFYLEKESPKLVRPQVRNGALWYIHNLGSLSSSAFSKIWGIQIKAGFVFLWCIDFWTALSPPGFILLPPEPCFLQPNCILVNFPNPKQWKTRGLPSENLDRSEVYAVRLRKVTSFRLMKH